MEELKACPQCDKDWGISDPDTGRHWVQKVNFCPVCGRPLNRRAAPENKPLTITFPCQIGDTVWMVGTVSRRDTEYTPYEYVLAVSTGFVREYGIYTGHWGAVVETKGGSFCYPLSEFDKSIFTSKDAAEQALAAHKPEGSRP